VAYHLVLVDDYSSDVEYSAARAEKGIRVGGCDVRFWKKKNG
jgi:hypothetical protein